MADHTDRLDALERVIQEIVIWKAGVMVEHETLKAGVSNFRSFQTRGNQFFDRFEAIADEEEKVQKKQWKRSDKLAIAAIFAVCILPPAGWVADRTIIFFSDLYQITQEWHQVHHGEIQQKKSFFPAPDSVYAEQKGSVDATIPHNP